MQKYHHKHNDFLYETFLKDLFIKESEVKFFQVSQIKNKQDGTYDDYLTIELEPDNKTILPKFWGPYGTPKYGIIRL